MSVIERVEEIWRETLEIDEEETIDRQKTFFDLGGNSLMAMIVLEDIKEEFKCNIEINELYQYDTIEKVANLVESRTNNSLAS